VIFAPPGQRRRGLPSTCPPIPLNNFASPNNAIRAGLAIFPFSILADTVLTFFRRRINWVPAGLSLTGSNASRRKTASSA